MDLEFLTLDEAKETMHQEFAKVKGHLWTNTENYICKATCPKYPGYRCIRQLGHSRQHVTPVSHTVEVW